MAAARPYGSAPFVAHWHERNGDQCCGGVRGRAHHGTGSAGAPTLRELLAKLPELPATTIVFINWARGCRRAYQWRDGEIIYTTDPKTWSKG